MMNLSMINGGFSTIYRLTVNNSEKVIKVINKNAITRFNRNNYHQDKEFYENLDLLNISPKHKILSKHIIQMDEIVSDFEIDKDKFFRKNDLLKQFKVKINLLKNLKTNLVKKSLFTEIISYKRTLKLIFNEKIDNYKLKNYINTFPQDRICHGDIHFKNLKFSNNNLYFLDWDYKFISSLSFELAMFSYLEKFDKSQIKILSNIFKIPYEEIEYFLPICKMLDVVYIYISKKRTSNQKFKHKYLNDVKRFIVNNL